MALPPLAWVPEHPALVTAEDVIHRPGCEDADELAAPVEAGAVLLRQRAPELCWRCRPDVTMMLGPQHAAAPAA